MIRWQAHDLGRVHALAYSPNGRRLASARHGSRAVVVHDPAAGAAVATLDAGGPVRVVAFGPAGDVLAVGADGRGVVVFDTADWRPAAELTFRAGVFDLAFHPAGGLAVFDNRRLLRWPDPRATGGPAHTTTLFRGGECRQGSFAFSPDGGRVLVNAPNMVRVFDGRTAAIEETVPHPLTPVRSRVVVAPAGDRVAASHGRDLTLFALGAYDPPVVVPGGKHCRSVRGLGFTPDGAGLLSAGSDGRPRLHDPVTGGLRQEWDFGLGNVQSLAVAPDGLTAAAGTDDGRIAVWDL